MIDEQQWITVPQAASLLDLRKRTVKRWIRAGRLQSQRDISGNLGVSLSDVEVLRRELFAEKSTEPIPDDQEDSPLERKWNFTDTAEPDASVMGEFIADKSYDDEPNIEDLAVDESTVDEPVVEPLQDPSPPEPETASAQSSAQNSPRDPLSALEHQAERSIQVAGAAFHEAKELAVTYREELQAARQEHREELHRVRRNGYFAWMLVAASVLVILGGAWFIGRQFGDQKLSEIRVSHLTDRLGETACENQKLQSRIEALKTESAGVASELRTAQLGQADAVGQLAAYRTHAGQLSHRVRVLETQVQQERSSHKQAMENAKRQAVLLERKRLALIRQQQAEQAERERQRITAQARAQREAAQRQQEQAYQAQQTLATRRRRAQAQRPAPRDDATLARVDQRTQMYHRRNATANLTLTELENALTPKK
jgi:excisionase family DNA binding protein